MADLSLNQSFQGESSVVVPDGEALSPGLFVSPIRSSPTVDAATDSKKSSKALKNAVSNTKPSEPIRMYWLEETIRTTETSRRRHRKQPTGMLASTSLSPRKCKQTQRKRALRQSSIHIPSSTSTAPVAQDESEVVVASQVQRH